MIDEVVDFNITVNCTANISTFDEDCQFINSTNNSTYRGNVVHFDRLSGSITAWHDFEVRKEEGMNILGLVVWSVAMGIVVSKLGEDGRILYKFFNAFAEATMKLVTLVIW
eukprot:GHVO01009004.1.p2 GENE.GHVO01009004.1~~GHVO01009004.1.p2  ORF type:complete len:111 (-),score=8.94 GHVO01009004.1:47-379(-)